ncbi:MAG: ABC transporter permease [candidate division Zixibacteria bacterium]|nr:ABC transporter permease [candidate division Zixibacteria bacterium]
MFKNYLVTAIRNVLRHKGYSAINIIGLAVGMACSLLIFLFVWHELSYDTYHPNYERIYRISTQLGPEGNLEGLAGCSENVAGYLRANHPEVEQLFRVQPLRPSTARVGDQVVPVGNIMYADNDLLTMFHMPVVQGDVREALTRPMTAVLTREYADQLFGDEIAVGQSILIDTTRYEVTAVVENSPSNTHLKFGIIISWATFDLVDIEEWRHSWFGGYFKTYVRLAEGVDPKDFEARIAGLIEEHAGETLRQQGRRSFLFLQPVADIHLNSKVRWEAEPPGNAAYVWILALVGGMILLIASLNFMNLATARSTGRAAEVGMRKVVGAMRGQLIWQFLGEMIITAGIALALGLVMVDLALPAFNELAGTRFSFSDLLWGAPLMGMLGVVLVTGGLAGLYPAFVLSAFRPVKVLKGATVSGDGGKAFRRVVVVTQFVMAIVLVVGSLTVYRQVEYMRSQVLGFKLDQKLVIEMPTEAVNYSSHEAIKQEFESHSLVKGATFSTSVPGRWNYQWRCFPTGEEATNTQSINWYGVDRDFLDEFGIEMVAGERFGPDCRGEMCEGVILNEAAVATFGWSSPEVAPGKGLWEQNRPVVGVARNFHLRGLQTPVEAMGMYIMSDDFRYLTLSVDAADLEGTVDFVKQKYAELFPGEVFNFFFLDEDFDRQYRAETRLGTIFGIFTVLGILVAALGLFGLASYTAELRTKEIGIRKVLGASEGNVIRLLTKETLVIVAIAVFLAWPVAYLAGNKWLEQFAFRTSVGWLTLLLAGGIALLIAVVSVGYQAIRAARANPVESLRYE